MGFYRHLVEKIDRKLLKNLSDSETVENALSEMVESEVSETVRDEIEYLKRLLKIEG